MILISGATGILGGMITHQLLRDGREVRILTRHNSPAEQMAVQKMATSPRVLIDAGAIPVYGDLKDRPTLDKACKGIETVITTANSAMRGGEDTVDTVDRRGNRNLIEASKAAGVKQFIFISFLGADLNHPVPLFQAKAEAEEFLHRSGLSYTILSPNFFLETWVGMVVGIPLQKGQPITLVGEGRRLHSFISIMDVAAFSVAAIDHPAALNRKFTLGGREALSWCGIVDTFSQEMGVKLPIQYVSPGEPIPGLPEIVPPTLAGMETYDSIIPMDDLVNTFGINQTTLTSVIRQMLKATPA